MEVGKYLPEFASKHLQRTSFVLNVATEDAVPPASSVNGIHHWSRLGSYSWEA